MCICCDESHYRNNDNKKSTRWDLSTPTWRRKLMMLLMDRNIQIRAMQGTVRIVEHNLLGQDADGDVQNELGDRRDRRGQGEPVPKPRES